MIDHQTCASCAKALLKDARYCTHCGVAVPRRRQDAAVGQDADDLPGDLSSDRASRLVECDSCGAGNAVSRPLCARCGTPMREEIPGGDALPQTTHDLRQPSPASPAGRDMPPVMLALVIIAGLVTAGVLLALVTSRVTADDNPSMSTGVALQAASASTALDGHPASLAIDGDSATAWTEAAEGTGDEEWIEVTMAAEVAVRRVLIWSGDQRDQVRFEENGHASAIRIEIADRQFRVRLQNVLGPQAIDLPEAVMADRLRIVVERAVAGVRYNDLAISEVVVEASP
ncbi:MAG: NADase-type glycan-binding domain-containing protein [Euzebya sp.]